MAQAGATHASGNPMQPNVDLEQLLAQMQPTLNPGRYAFVAVPDGVRLDPDQIIASVRESEGLSAIMREQDALDRGLPVAFVAAWITLTVHSDLAAVGLTAAFAHALAEAGIACNVVAGVRHDHLFVPYDHAQQAMAALRALAHDSVWRPPPSSPASSP